MQTQEPKSISQEPSAEPRTPNLPASTILWYSLASLGCGTFFGFNIGDIPLFLERYTSNAILIGLMASTHSIEGIIIQPLVGAISDRCRHPLGRRRPFMIVFMLLAAVFLIATPFAQALPPAILLPGLIAGIFLFTVTFNIGFDPYQALMPDITPEGQRGRVFSMFSFLGVLGQAGLLALPVGLDVKFGIVAAMLASTTLLTCWRIKEIPLGDGPVATRNYFGEAAHALKGLKTLHQAAKALAVAFLFGIGTGTLLPFLTTFTKVIAGSTPHQAELTLTVLMVTSGVFVLPFGYLTDRVSPRVVLMVSLGLIGIAMAAGLWVTTLPQLTALMVLAGIGNAAQSASMYPLITQLIPEEETGFYTGLQTMALSLVQPITVVFTGAAINHTGYRVIFGICAVSMALGLAVAATVKRRRASIEIAARLRELDERFRPTVQEY